ncbi:MAG TPA: hypothetical protein VK203_28250 [Nostocaceae cyanobacterium]|nr:hypothetical protein [Nostocaceae cyanobacterium]
MAIPSAPSGQNILSGINYCFNVTKTSATNLNIAVRRWNYLKDRPKNFISVKDWLKTKDNAEKAKKTADNLINGKWKDLGKLGKFAQAASFAMAAIGYVLGIKNAGDIQTLQNVSVNVWEAQSREFERNLRLFKKQDTEIKQIEKKIKILDSDTRTTGLRAQQAFTNSVKARELGNNALYEARQGRVKLDAKINSIQASVNKFASNTNTRLSTLTLQYQNIVKQITANAQNTIQQTIKQLQAQITAQQAKINTQQTQINTQQVAVNNINNAVKTVTTTVNNIPNQITDLQKTTNQKITDLQKYVVTLVAGSTRPIEIKANNLEVKQQKLEQEIGVTKREFQGQITTVTTQVVAANKEVFNTKQKVELVSNNVNPLVGLKPTLDNLRADTQKLKQDQQKLQDDLKTQQDNLKEQEKKLKEQDKLNLEGLNLLKYYLPLTIARVDGLTPTINKIPAQTVNQLKPEIPPLVEEAVCNSANGGCLSGALNQNANNINAATTAANNDLLSKIGALLNGLSVGLDAASLAKLDTIDNKLGEQLPDGGIAGKLKRGFKWLQIDRVTNLLTLWVTLHNAFMLSNQLGDTLLTVIENGLTVIGVKDENDQPIDLNPIIGNTVSGLISNAIGAENYGQLTKAWLKANRIYQASANVVNSVVEMNDAITNGLEVVGGQNAKIGNALRNYRVVGEKAYEVFNPQPNFHHGFFAKVQKAQEKADALLQISQVPLEIGQVATELTESATELTKAIKEDPEVSKGIAIADAEQTKLKEQTVSSNSIATAITELDLANDE